MNGQASFVILVAWLCIQSIRGQTLPYAVDLFTNAQEPALCTGASPNTTLEAVQGDFIGSRVLGCTMDPAGENVTSSAHVDGLTCLSFPPDSGQCIWEYTDIGGENLDANGCACWDVIIDNNGGNVNNIQIEAWDSDGLKATSSFGIEANSGTNNICLEPDNQGVFQSVDRIKLTVDESATISQFCCSSNVVAWHVIEPRTSLTVGDCSTITYNAMNPPRVPEKEIPLGFTFPTPTGFVTDGSVTCNIEDVMIIRDAYAVVVGNAMLPTDSVLTCSWEVCWEEPGNFTLWGIAEDRRAFTFSYSNEGVNRFGTPSFCEESTPSLIEVSPPPTTLAPTTTPPTEEPTEQPVSAPTEALTEAPTEAPSNVTAVVPTASAVGPSDDGGGFNTTYLVIIIVLALVLGLGGLFLLIFFLLRDRGRSTVSNSASSVVDFGKAMSMQQQLFHFSPELYQVQEWMVIKDKTNSYTQLHLNGPALKNDFTALKELNRLQDLLNSMDGSNHVIVNAWAIDNSKMYKRFSDTLHDLVDCHESDPETYMQNAWVKTRSSKRIAVMAHADAKFGILEWNSQNSVKVMVAAHVIDKADIITTCARGFRPIEHQDGAWYGTGIYFTTSLTYAALFEPAATMFVAITYVIMGNTYPVVEDPYADSKSLLLKDIKEGYQSHYVLVDRQGKPIEDIFAAKKDGELFDELVVPRDEHVFLKYIVEVKTNRKGGDIHTSGT
eukprot:CAMPEP_0168518858 /NCGR_PEP_ID=MMETSP0405-20121227/6971_1 /TAXON_ID=498012 /ORGANISM="Trichosphaerium sp, Strain Am-I-7 wt" /LENGTH=720 /DNA_ID=CAMNT_0008539287 /DNA_START=1235 /DNA_END=3400 /DNA_ORIENTATION=+